MASPRGATAPKKRKTRGDKGRYLEMLVDFGRLKHAIPRPYFKNADGRTDGLRDMASPRGATAPNNLHFNKSRK